MSRPGAATVLSAGGVNGAGAITSSAARLSPRSDSPEVETLTASVPAAGVSRNRSGVDKPFGRKSSAQVSVVVPAQPEPRSYATEPVRTEPGGSSIVAVTADAVPAAASLNTVTIGIRRRAADRLGGARRECHAEVGRQGGACRLLRPVRGRAPAGTGAAGVVTVTDADASPRLPAASIARTAYV